MARAGPCHVSEIPLQKGKNPFGKGERSLAGEERRLPFDKGNKIPAHMTRAIDFRVLSPTHGAWTEHARIIICST
jgi:hypothetical protein